MPSSNLTESTDRRKPCAGPLDRVTSASAAAKRGATAAAETVKSLGGGAPRHRQPTRAPRPPAAPLPRAFAFSRSRRNTEQSLSSVQCSSGDDVI